MKYIAKFFTLLAPLLQKLGTCAIAGFIAGSFAGFILWVYYTFNGPLTNLSSLQIVQLSLLLTLIAWLVILFGFIILARVSFLSVWYQTLFNAFLTCLLTLIIVYKLNLWVIAYLVGMIIGILVGLLLCYINGLLKKNNV